MIHMEVASETEGFWKTNAQVTTGRSKNKWHVR